jgi:hypothetical protein
MPDLQIIRGDTYALRRPLYRHEIVNGAGNPFNLTGCTVRTTFKVAPNDPDTDATDASAVIKGTLIVDSSGTATTQSKLFLVGDAVDGICELRLSAADTLALPLAQTWRSDVELTDSNGEVFTFVFTDGLSAADGYTNRTSG